MKYRALYESEGNAALKVDIPQYCRGNERIIPFPGNPNAARTRVRREQLLCEEYHLQESVTVEEVPFDIEYIDARHLFCWMTDETPAQLRAKHAPVLSPMQRKAYYYADRVRNAVVNHPFAVQLAHGTLAGNACLMSKKEKALFYLGVTLYFGTLYALSL